jgi:Protein of unknown function (DUF3567)
MYAPLRPLIDSLIKGVFKMNLVYNSEHYSVLEFPTHGGFELIDKHGKTSAFIVGEIASKFRESMQDMFSNSPSVESIDEFLDDYETPSEQQLRYH